MMNASLNYHQSKSREFSRIEHGGRERATGSPLDATNNCEWNSGPNMCNTRNGIRKLEAILSHFKILQQVLKISSRSNGSGQDICLLGCEKGQRLKPHNMPTLRLFLSPQSIVGHTASKVTNRSIKFCKLTRALSADLVMPSPGGS
jgi:hypothetical protein